MLEVSVFKFLQLAVNEQVNAFQAPAIDNGERNGHLRAHFISS